VEKKGNWAMVHKTGLLVGLGAIITAGVFAVLFSQITWRDVGQLLLSIDRRLLGFFVVLSLMQHVTRTLRYHLLLKAAGQVVGLGRLFVVVLVRSFCVDLLPARTGELVYIYLLRTRLGVELGAATASFALAFLFDIMVLGPLVVLAALAISYVLGEGLGRLSCVSYGCCYGKPLKDCHWLTRKIFSHCFFVFTGATKKVAYDGGLEGEKLLPIQALTCVLYTATALISSHYFLQGSYAAAFLLSLIVSQLWRFLSETMRADFRGFGRISVYQKMSLVALPYAILIAYFVPAAVLPAPSIILGLSILVQPLPMIGLQLLWLSIFLFFGRSTATGSTVSFHVVKTDTP